MAGPGGTLGGGGIICDPKSSITRGTLWHSTELEPPVGILGVAPDTRGVSRGVPAVVVLTDIREGVGVGGGGGPPLAGEAAQGGAAGARVVSPGCRAVLAADWQVLGGHTGARVKEQKQA